MATTININLDDEEQEDSQVIQAIVQSFFEDLGLLHKYYPQRLTILDGLCVSEKTLNAVSCTDVKEVPWLVLQKIMSFDSRSRTNLLKLPDTQSNEETDRPIYSSDKIHPMDATLALFLCADDFLRQDMMVRLTSCQLAIPLVLRDPFTQELILPLWALSSIVKSWRTVDHFSKKIMNFEHQITEFEIPIVSIIRLGKHKVSKSKLLNNAISSNDQQQDYFFHRDCNGGSFNRLLGNGVIDMCWYLPAGEEDIFPEPITFVNLHGDACDSTNEKQVKFLSKISTLCLVLAPESFLNAESVNVLKKFTNFTLLIKGKKPTNLDAEFPSIKVIYLNKNEDHIKTCLCEEINNAVFSADMSKKTIALLDNLAQNCKIIVDSRGKFLADGKKIASSSLTEIHLKPGFKAENLPLQGKMWQAWARYDKEQKRQMNRNKSIQEYEAEIEEKKCQIRAEQGKQLPELSPIMVLFIENLKSYDFKTVNYYLQCLKIHLNNFSRDTISQVRIRYHETRNELRKYQNTEQNNSDHISASNQTPQEKKLKEKLDELHGELFDLAFGFEHLLREIGQIYETSIENETLKENFSHLPGVAAKLLMYGYPLEIMDGDVAHMPIKWVQAILNETAELLGDPRIFVLSVLGLQSTGKSTLLNTIFGLQFNVSSERWCHQRGAYMQLLPISENMRSDIECDYILVIDTEGLRASAELDPIQSQKHDNELATFVIGLANDTLINIYGEVAGDMDDILQISVHAFIRMREIKIKPSCQFVHQNAAGARGKAQMGNRFIQKLDEMTRYAASEEGCQDQFQHFRDVINFDEQSDVHYFECLWVGDPPMAPVNPGYSASAQSLKSHIIKRIQDTKCSRLSSFSCNMKDLWDALLAENFVFSFKNSFEIQAYNLLETSYSQWEWELKEIVLKWEEKVAEEVKAASSVDALDRIIEEELNPVSGELVVLISDTHEKLNEEMAKYFKEARQSEVIAQWKSSFERKLEKQSQLLKEEKMSLFEQLCTGKKAFTKVCQQKFSYKLKFHYIAEDLKKQSTNPTEEQVKVEFNKSWNVIIQSLPAVHQLQDPAAVKIEVETELILFLGHGAERSIVQFQLSAQRKSQTALLELSISKEHHLSRKVDGLICMKGALKKVAGHDIITDSHVRRAQELTNTILKIVPKFLEEVKTYSRAHVTRMLKKLDDATVQICENEQEFTFTRQYRADLFATACNYAIKQFEQMVEAFNRKNDPMACLEEELKDDLFDIFKNKMLPH